LIGPYRILRELARGGMGIVYLARDTRLDRTVALKALPEDVATDPERLQRFEREARLLASLNHPNIATIYGIESSEGRRYLALEYIEGESLAARIAKGSLSIEETLEIGSQIAAGVEAAHEAGIIHRDLKPANVVITDGQRVKVLDFGLAKGKETDADDARVGDSPAVTPSSPTVTRPQNSPTIPGVILGTAPYLSPEQARGRPVDRRTDIWSFGCVLYECLTGSMAFCGETISDTIALILTSDPDWSKLPVSTPVGLRALVQRCLVKDPRRRLRDIGEARLSLEDVRTSGASSAGRGVAALPMAAAAGESGVTRASVGSRPWFRRLRLSFLVAGAIGFLFAAAFWNLVLHKAGPSTNREVIRLSVPFPSDLRVPFGRLSADGQSFVIFGMERNPPPGRPPRSQIYVRRLSGTRYEPLPGTERAVGFILSPDGKWVEFIANASAHSPQMQVFKLPIDGSAPPILVARAQDEWGIPIFLHSGDQLFPLANGTHYVRLAAGSSTASAPISYRLNAPVYELLDVLPGDRGVLFGTGPSRETNNRSSVGVLDLKSGKSKVLIPDAGSAKYSSTGNLVFTRGDALLAVRFDPASLEIKGQPVAIQGGLPIGPGYVHAPIQLSNTGTLLYLTAGEISPDRRIVAVNGEGAVSEWSSERNPYQMYLDASPDGSHFTSTILSNGHYETWVGGPGGEQVRPIASSPASDCWGGAWSPDSRRVAYTVIEPDTRKVYVVDREGSSEARQVANMPAPTRIYPTSWSPDGRVLLATAFEGYRGSLLTIDISSGGSAPQALFGGTVGKSWGMFSPDGGVIAYASDETGRDEVFLSVWDASSRSPVGRPVRVSSGGGAWPRWSSDGKRVYLQNQENQILAATISRTPTLAASAPKPMWDLDAIGAGTDMVAATWDILPDGRLLAIRKGVGEDDTNLYELALNFDEELKAKVK
jgi:Tol biopolymer transport system component